MKLNEIKRIRIWNEKILNDPEYLGAFIESLGVDKYHIDPKTMEVTASAVYIRRLFDYTELPPIKWKTVASFNCADIGIDSFNYFPKHVKGSLIMNNNRFVSLHGINKHVEFIGDSLIVDAHVTHVLGLFFIKGLKLVHFLANRETHRLGEIRTNRQKEKERIVNEHLAHGDIHSCQEALIDAGCIYSAKI